MLDFEKTSWTSNSVTINSLRVLKDKLVKSVGRELSGIYSHKNYRQHADSSPKICKFFVVILFCLILTKMGLPGYFLSFSKIFPQFSENFRQVHVGCTIVLLLTDCEVHMGKYSDRSAEARTERSDQRPETKVFPKFRADIFVSSLNSIVRGEIFSDSSMSFKVKLSFKKPFKLT